MTTMTDLIGKEFKVLDKGFIRVVDLMGDDSSIVQAARVSYGEGTKQVRQDEALIRYLMRHHHNSPLEMCSIKLHIKVPIYCFRQWIRHRTAKTNEASARYSIAISDKHSTNPGQWRLQSKKNKQGSENYINKKDGYNLSNTENMLHALSQKIYNKRIEMGVAREQARKDLPLSNYTEAFWKIDLRNLFNFLKLRMDEHAQEEIREYAKIIGYEIVSEWCPIAWKAFLDYQVNAINLSSIEVYLISEIHKNPVNVLDIMQEISWLSKHNEKWKSNREAKEFAIKLKKIGIPVPWRKNNV